MMSASLFALFDDIASIMDDVATMSKIAIKKSAGVTGDDFAVSANQVSGIAANREIPVMWKITKGSLINKMLLLVVLLTIAYVAPVIIPGLLVLGACYLAYEGAEKVLEKIGLHSADEETASLTEEQKIKGALQTDLVLSAEIMVIALGATAGASFLTKAGVLFAVAIGITFLIYGVVTLLIRLDDMGYALIRSGKMVQLGSVMVNAAPKIMRGLSVVGTLAMFMVSGGIFAHNVSVFHAVIEVMVPAVGTTISEMLMGLVLGLLLVGCTAFVKKLIKFVNH